MSEFSYGTTRVLILTGFEALLRTPWLKSLAQRLIGDKAGLNVTTTWYLTDHLGSNVATADAAGQVLERSRFAPYGERWGKLAEQGPAYTGHYEDPTGLTYMKARYHSGIVGRFISPDPVQVDTSSGGNFNRYWYGNNNPEKFVDPDGRNPAVPEDQWKQPGPPQLQDHFLEFFSDTVNGFKSDAEFIGSLNDVPSPGQVLRLGVIAAGIALPEGRAASVELRVVVGEKLDGLIYRAASGTPDSMTPRPVDLRGLSAANSFENALPGRNMVIDTSKLNNLCAYCDDPVSGHVSIVPIDPTRMQAWMDSRGGPEVHPLTRELMDAVVERVKK